MDIFSNMLIFSWKFNKIVISTSKCPKVVLSYISIGEQGVIIKHDYFFYVNSMEVKLVVDNVQK